MVTKVSQTTVTIDGQKACTICARRPQKRNAKGKWLSYCAECFAELERQRRAGRTWMLLTPDEARAIKASRAQPGGRHHARLRVLPWMMNAVLWQLPLWVALLARARG